MKDPATSQFRKFKTPEEGYTALLNDLQTKVSGKSTTGLTGSSTLYDFAKTYAPANDQNDPAKYAADLANFMKVRPDTQIGTLQSRIGDFAQAVARREGYSGAKNFTATTTQTPMNASNIPSNPIGTVNAAGASPQKSGQQGLVSTAVDAIGKGINFLFPIAGDIKDAVQGNGHKTGTQYLADAALSALPFVPGLGEAGLLAKGTEGAVEGARALSGGAKILRAGAEGYGISGLQNVSQGKDLGQSFAPSVGNFVGAGLSAATAGLVHGGNQLVDKASGIPSNIKPVLSDVKDPRIYEEYVKAGKARAEDVRNPSAHDVLANYAEKATKGIQQKIKKVGVQVGETKRLEGFKKLQSVDGVMRNIVKNLDEKFGLTIRASKTGRNISIENSPGRMKSVLTPTDQNRVKTALKQLLTLRKGGNVRQASDVLDNLTNLVDYSKKDLIGNSNDPLEGFLKSVRHDLNDVVGQSSKKLAQVKSRFHTLSDALEEISGAGGSNLQRVDLLAKRALSGDKSRVSREVFDTIKKETGIDLFEHSVIADHVKRIMEDPSQGSILNKYLENAAEKGMGQSTIYGDTKKALISLLKQKVANPEKVGRDLVNGKGPSGAAGLFKKGLIRNAGRIPSALGL